jgi:hypothetical protein
MMQRAKSLLNSLKKQQVRLAINIFGQPKAISGVLLRYSKPFILLRTRQATRIINENMVHEIVPINVDVLKLMEFVA